MIRLFVGIKIEKLTEVVALSKTLQRNLSKDIIRWTSPESFHLTLKFLGEVESFYINSINNILKQVSQKHNPFNLEFNKLGTFSNHSKPRVIWHDFKSNTELDNLQRSIDIALSDLGFKKEINKYKPHLTFGRVKKLNSIEFSNILLSHPNITKTLQVSEFQLIESELTPSGPIYSTLTSYNLTETGIKSEK